MRTSERYFQQEKIQACSAHYIDTDETSRLNKKNHSFSKQQKVGHQSQKYLVWHKTRYKTFDKIMTVLFCVKKGKLTLKKC